MSNLQQYKNCPMRSKIGNCLAMGGFCTSVSEEICEALQNAYTNGKHSVEVSEDTISRVTVLDIYSDLYWTDERLLNFKDELDKVYEKLRTAPSVIPNVDIRREGFKEGFNEGMLYERRFANRPKGEWIFKTIFPNDKSEFPMGYLVCSVCGSQHRNSTPCNYCDNCGSRMKGAQDE